MCHLFFSPISLHAPPPFIPNDDKAGGGFPRAPHPQLHAVGAAVPLTAFHRLRAPPLSEACPTGALFRGLLALCAQPQNQTNLPVKAPTGRKNQASQTAFLHFWDILLLRHVCFYAWLTFPHFPFSPKHPNLCFPYNDGFCLAFDGPF